MLHVDPITRRTKGAASTMRHPSNRAERRHERLRIIAHRRFVRVNAGRCSWPDQLWAQYSKWNGGCGSMLCHELKYFGHRRKRREALRNAGKDEE